MNPILGTATQVGAVIPQIARSALSPRNLLNVAAPFGAYQVLTGRGVTPTDALIVAAAFPLAAILLGAARTRRVDFVGALTLGAIGVGLVGTLAFHDPRFLLVKDSAITGLLGLACLVSLLTPRPLLFVLGRQFITGGDPKKVAEYDARWQLASVRANLRFVTLVWGVALVAEASIRVGLSFVVAPATLLAISPVLALCTFGPLALWTLRRRTAQGRRSPTRVGA